MKTVLYTKYNKLRREEYRISTMICEENGTRFVEKKALHPKAKAQIERIYSNSLTIGDAYNRMEILIPEFKTDRVVYEYLKGTNLESSLVECLDDYPMLVEEMTKALDVITDIHEKYRVDFEVTDGYKEAFGEPWCEEGEPSSNWTNIDVLFDNIVIKDNRYICLDCEWVFDFPIPFKLVKYRCLFYFYQKYEAYLKKWADLTVFLNAFGINEDEKELYMNAERNFQMYVVGKDFENDYVYKYEQPAHKLDTMVDEVLDLQEQLQGKYAHVEHLEGIVVEKSYEVDRLNHEMILKEQHVQNLNVHINNLETEINRLSARIKTIEETNWYKLRAKAASVKNKVQRK